MHLEDVHVEGFKSFSEKTSMAFQPGIGVIIGNNGVGKSNILDAIVWALGEDNLDRLRCYERDELFFSGSKAYPPANRIKIELSFKESAEKDSPVIRLARELPRDGRDRYRIDDQSASREEYKRKLAGLRLVHVLKTIVRQEEINDILQRRPRDRFRAVQSLLDMEMEADAARSIRDDIAPLFYRYMAHLMPLGTARLDLISENGKRGLEIEVTLPGNRVRRVHQLSGGEKSITSLALKLAIFHQLDSSFFLLDEVEPSLDYINHKSIQAFLKDVSSDRQLVMITHLRTTIDLADTLHGIRTRFDGSSFMKFYFLMDKRFLRLFKGCC